MTRAFWRSGVCIIFLFFVILTGSGCALLGHQFGKQTDAHAEDIINRIQAFNAQISTSKGTAELMLARGFRNQKYKIAWAAQSPNRLRMTLLMSGHPVETIASTGQWVTFVSHTGTHKPHSAVSTDPDLDPYINIPLRLSELVSLLLGKVPGRPFDRAWVLPEQPGTVFASQSFSSEIQEWVTNESGRTIRYRVLDKDKNIIFGIWYSQFFNRDNFILPRMITIKDGAQNVIKIYLKNIMPNIPVKESVFRLTGS
ncbi:LolA family protein [Desulfobacter latus]|uniref:Outer-membrane lipoprotein LolB n=1 Tax=Desulfobacter latus TaxID=2292 RepID=A0A850TA84_9BACT|nr:hypothetical protein [Desulfobacter latus]NWH04286.1 hypothetical protein [Desulfobacter latus]